MELIFETFEDLDPCMTLSKINIPENIIQWCFMHRYKKDVVFQKNFIFEMRR